MSLQIVKLQESAAYWTEKVVDGTCSGLAIVGPGGLGKTWIVEEVLAKRKISVDQKGRNSHITPLALYKTLYEYRDAEVVLLDDIEHVYKQEVSVGILRAALWPMPPKKRWVTYSTSRDIGVPDRFQYKGGIIIVGNKIPREDDPIVSALLTRIPCVEFGVESADVYAFMLEKMIKRDGYFIYDGKRGDQVRIPRRECEKVVGELRKRDITDLRKLEHALIAWQDFKKQPARLERELDNLARRARGQRSFVGSPKSRAREIFLKLLNENGLDENKKAELFEERTRGLRPGHKQGYSRPTFFRWKQKLAEGAL